MEIAVIKEIKDKENRVGLTPEGAKHLTSQGHTVLVDKGAGVNSGFSDEEYESAGASIVSTEQAWNAPLIVKVKEPMEEEYAQFKKDQIIFTYFHLAGVPVSLTHALLEKGVTAIAYETVQDENKKLPLLAPMSAVAGNMAITIGGYYLAKFNNGRGMELGTVLGKKYGKVLVIGDGAVGQHAAKAAYGMGTDVYLFGIFEDLFEQHKKNIGPELNCVYSSKENIAEHVKDADLVVGGVLLPGKKAPWVVTEDMIKTMQPGSVVVDVSIDQGGCIETSKPTSHSDPVFEKHGVIHYCVTNMPGAYPRTSTIALTAATLPYLDILAKEGLDGVKKDPGFVLGVNTHAGAIVNKDVAVAMEMDDKYKEF